MTALTQRFLHVRAPLSRILLKRPFFASSTDHTTLLQTAAVHRLDCPKGSGHQQYVLAADGMEAEMVQKVPQLHLARLWRDDQTLYGAKVVNSTLGAPQEVCARLFDAACKDVNDNGEMRAKATLTGLSEWALSQSAAIDSLEEKEWAAVQQIAKKGNDTEDAIYQEGKEAWEKLAKQFLEDGLSEEAALYQSKGGVLTQILHHQDTSDYSKSSGGAVAEFVFSS